MKKKIIIFILCVAVCSSMFFGEAYAEINGIKPSEACDLFIDTGLATSGWQIYYDYVCGCSSEHEHSLSSKTATEPSTDKLSYFVEGTCKKIRRLKLSVEIEGSDTAENRMIELQNAARVLIEQITEQPVPSKIHKAITEGKNLNLKIGETIVTVTRIDWTKTTDKGPVKGYQIAVTLE